MPFQSITITARVGAPISATISLVPLSEIKFIKARTQVHVFLQDTKNFPDNEFYLMFEGEVLGRQMSKKQDSRTFSVVALDYSSYWDLAKVYTMSPNYVVGKVEDAVTLQDAPLNQTVQFLQGQVLQTSATSNTRIVEIILAPLKPGGDANKDLAQGVANVVRQLGGVNQFFATAYERLRIVDRLQVFSGNKLQTFLNELSVEEFLKDFSGKFGGISSLRELIYSVMSLIFHDFVSVPFPAYIKPSTVDSNGVVTNPASQKITEAEKTSSIGRTLSSFLFIPDCYSLPPPACNIIFPNQMQGYTFMDDFQTTPTRYAFRASMPLMTGAGNTTPQYPTQFFPDAFSDYMFKGKTATPAEIASQLGPSTLLTDSKTGNAYANISYSDVSKSAVGISFSPTLRESDYLSNEESIKGIYADMDTFLPGYTALIKNASSEARTTFIQGIGAYLYFKKRFSARQSSAELIFNPFLVPGFTALFLDDSEAGQSFLAKLQSVTHVVTNEGSMTQVDLAYCRDFDEVDELTGASGEPPAPPWFDTEIFGSVDLASFQQETAYLSKMGAISSDEVFKRDLITNPTTYTSLNTFFQALLGCNASTNFSSGASGTPSTSQPQICSTRGAVSYFLYQYRQVSSNPVARDAKVLNFVTRPMVPILAAFDFIRAQPAGWKNNGKFKLPRKFAAFSAQGPTTNSGAPNSLPYRFDGGTTSTGGTVYADQGQVAARRKILASYIQRLKTQRGFRG